MGSEGDGEGTQAVFWGDRNILLHLYCDDWLMESYLTWVQFIVHTLYIHKAHLNRSASLTWLTTPRVRSPSKQIMDILRKLLFKVLSGSFYYIATL